MIELYKDGHKKLPYALWGYHTSTKANPYSLIYGIGAILTIKLEFPWLRVLEENKKFEAEWSKKRYKELILLNERKLWALYHI